MLAFCFFCPGNPLYNVLWENRVWPKEPLAQDPRKTCAREMVPGQVPPVQPRSFKRISYKKKLLINLGLIVALPPMTAKSQATKFLAFLLRFTKKIWFWLQHAKVPRILHAMNGICWNPHARKSAQGRSARGPNIPKSYRNFRQPPYTYILYYIYIDDRYVVCICCLNVRYCHRWFLFNFALRIRIQIYV